MDPVNFSESTCMGLPKCSENRPNAASFLATSARDLKLWAAFRNFEEKKESYIPLLTSYAGLFQKQIVRHKIKNDS